MGLSGNYPAPRGPDALVDSCSRLHDLRSPSSYIACFTDIVDPFCAIYSLLPLSCGRLIAGSSNLAMLKVFNIHTELENHCRRGTLKHTEVQSPHNVVYGSPPDDPARDLRNGRDWNVFLTDRGRFASMQSKTQRGTDSPVYSLSSPSPYSPTIFAGLEGQVIQLDFTSVYDRFPDPIFGFGSKLSRRGEKSAMHQRDVARKWNPDHEVMCLAMYEQVTGVPMLRQQVPVGEIGDEIPGWDERWRHPSKRRRWE